MVLGDWEKVKENSEEIVYKKGSKRIVIDDDSLFTNVPGWRTKIYGEKGITLRTRLFKTKPQAITFAKNYMRKH